MSARESIENLWDRATPVRPLLDKYRDEAALDLGRDLLRDGLDVFLTRLVGPENAARVLADVRRKDAATVRTAKESEPVTFGDEQLNRVLERVAVKIEGGAP
jgi:hypothetical protein